MGTLLYSPRSGSVVESNPRHKQIQLEMIAALGVRSSPAAMLEASGVDTVKELKHRNAENLAAKK